MALIPASVMDQLTSINESAMPDECHLSDADVSTDSLGKRHKTGTYTLKDTADCRWRELSGRELEVARGLAEYATHEIKVPLDTPVVVEQRAQVYQNGVLALTARVVWVGTGSYATAKRVLCSEVNT